MRHKFGFYPFDAMDYKAGQAYLERREAQGWRLRHIYLGSVALFEKAERPRHFVDLDIRPFLDEEPDQDYLQLCADAGWEHVQTLRGMLLFRAAEGADPVPIQSDAGMEWERFWRKYARKNLISSLLILLVSAALVAAVFGLAPHSGRSITVLATSNSALLYLLSLGLGLVSILLSFVMTPLYLFRCRRSGQVETPGRAAWFQDTLFQLYRPLYIIAACIALAEIFGAGTTVDLSWDPIIHQEYTASVEVCREYPVVLAADLELPSDQNDGRWLDGHRSLLSEYFDFREITGSSQDGTYHNLITERYECINEVLARWVFGQRARETRGGAFLWGELDWEDAPGLGFEECYTCREGSYLLLRQGNVAALVGCTGLDLTEAGHLSVVRTRLGL